MICSCGNKQAYRILLTYGTQQGRRESCDQCGVFGTGVFMPDVYFKEPYRSEALDTVFTSRRQKADYLKRHGLSEAGDKRQGKASWVEGTRAYRQAQFEKDRPKIRETYKRYLERAKRIP